MAHHVQHFRGDSFINKALASHQQQRLNHTVQWKNAINPQMRFAYPRANGWKPLQIAQCIVQCPSRKRQVARCECWNLPRHNGIAATCIAKSWLWEGYQWRPALIPAHPSLSQCHGFTISLHHKTADFPKWGSNMESKVFWESESSCHASVKSPLQIHMMTPQMHKSHLGQEFKTTWRTKL